MERIELDMQKIKGRMKEKNITQNQMSQVLAITPYSFSKKINKKKDFKLSEIECMFNELGVAKEEIGSFFRIQSCLNATKKEATYEYIGQRG